MVEQKTLVYELKEEGYEEIDIEGLATLNHILDTGKILFFIDPKTLKVWVWVGKTTTTKMKFISAKIASEIRDKHAITYTISTADEHNEPEEFMLLLGLEEEIPVS